MPLTSFNCLLALVRTSSTIFEWTGTEWSPCLLTDYTGIALGISPFKLILAIGLFYLAFTIFSHVSCNPDLAKTFNMKGYWILSKAFVASLEMITFLSLILFIWWVTLMEFCILNQVCIPGMTPTLQYWMMLLMYSWIWFESILWSIFASMFIRQIGLKFSFFVESSCVWVSG